MKIDKKVVNGRLVIPGAGIIQADVLISDGKITGICSSSDKLEAAEVFDVHGSYVFPGIIDCHVHYGMGPTYKEGVYGDVLTESRSAGLGGVTTTVTFYQNPKSYLEVFESEKEEAERRAYIDFAIHFVLMNENHLREVKHYVEDLGVSSFKFFMNFRGDEGKAMGVEAIDDGFLYEGLEAISKHKHATAIIHAENIEIGWRFRRRLKEEGRDGLSIWTESKPGFIEVENVLRVCYYGKIVNCRIYIAHVSTKESCEELRRLRKESSQIFAETCTHYLTLTKEYSLGNVAKVSPPLRTGEDIKSLWGGVEAETLDVISSDHVPRKLDTKRGNIWECSLGFPGTATLLPLVLSEGYHKRGLSLVRIAELLSRNPARIFNMYPRKGSIQVGSDADLTVVDLDLEKTVSAHELGSFSDYSVYDGWRLKGWPILTMVRGQVIMREGRLVGNPGYGKFISR